jgi:putative membrane protein
MRNPRSIFLAGSCSIWVMVACAKDSSRPPAEFPEPVQSDVTPAPAPTAEASAEVSAEVGSGGDSVAATTPAADQSSAPSPAFTGGALNDAQIAKIADTVNAGEIEQAQVARRKAKQAKVKSFAQHMITEHTRAKRQASALAKQLDLMLEESAVSQELAGEATRALEALNAADAAQFDKHYIDAQVEQHHNVLELLDTQLIPQATDAKLKAQLKTARTMVESHLNQAKKIGDTE